MGLLHASVTSEPLDAAWHHRTVEAPTAGAVASFTGMIRNHDPQASGEVTGIDYSHHPDADALLARIVRRVLAASDPDDEARVAVSHRVGHLDVGELALVCCVATPHRAQAFALCAAIVEAIKDELPIWKRQSEASGRAVWSNLDVEPA